MKRLLLLSIAIWVTILVSCQSTIYTNFTIQKVNPVLRLNGTSAQINFYNGDLTLTQSSNLLTLEGGDFSLGANNLRLTGNIGLTGSRITKGWFGDLEITNPPSVNGTPMAISNWNTAYTERRQWDGSATNLVPATGRTSLGATTVGSSLFTLTNPSAIQFLRINVDNTVTALSDVNFKTALALNNVTNESKTTMFTSPTFTGTVTIPSPFTLGTTSVTSSGMQLDLLNIATGRTGTGDIVYGTSPTFTTSVIMPSSFNLGATMLVKSAVVGGEEVMLNIVGNDTTLYIPHKYREELSTVFYEFDVRDYGAISGDGLCDADAIQAAINAAFAYGGGVYGKGAIVYIPIGTWNINKRITLKSGVRVKCEYGSMFWMPDAYASSVWYSPGPLTNSGVTGGFYRCNTYGFTFIELYSGTFDDYIAFNTFRDIWVYNCNYGIKVYSEKVSGTYGGWVNHNVFDNVYISRPRIGISILKGTGSEGSDGNLFTNCGIQTYGAGSDNPTEKGIETNGAYNSFTNFNLWDWEIAATASLTVDFSTGAYSNYINGMGFLQNNDYNDDGFSNTIESEGKINMVSEINVRRRYADVNGTEENPAGTTGIKFGDYYTDLTSDNYTAKILSRQMSAANSGSQLVFQTHPTSSGAGLQDAVIIDQYQNTEFKGNVKIYTGLNSQADNYQLVLGDIGKLVLMTKATANTLTVPANATVAFPIGTQINVCQTGAGAVTFVAATDVTINSANSSLGLRTQYSTATLIKTATNVWLLIGDI